jgi:hypothetical protein
MAAIPRSLLSIQGKKKLTGPFFKKAPFTSHYEETGSGFPLLLTADGGIEFHARRPDQRLAGRIGRRRRPPRHHLKRQSN